MLLQASFGVDQGKSLYEKASPDLSVAKIACMSVVPNRMSRTFRSFRGGLH